MAWGSLQSLQHEQNIFEARLWWTVVGGKGMPRVLGLEFQLSFGSFCDGGCMGLACSQV